ncbi:MAG: phage major capsid protein [Bartonella sp.]|nr:phage major capsid protein [Bartonella sp.]
MSDETTKSAADLGRELKEQFDKKLNEVKETAERALSRHKEELTQSQKEKADEQLIELNKLKAQITELEQKSAQIRPIDLQKKTLGQEFVDCEEFITGHKIMGSKSTINMYIKADITTANTGNAGDAGAAIAPNRLPGIQELPKQRLTIRNLIAPGHTELPTVSYTVETGFTNNAGVVAEGKLKPQSDITLANKTVNTQVIAHWTRATKQILSDAPQVQSLINSRLIYGLQLKEEYQLLHGDGTGDNLHGIIPQASAFNPPAGLTTPTPTTGIDIIRIAMLQAALAEYPATAHVLNPIDWAGIELLKDSEGRYLIGNPQGTLTPTLWGLPVITTQSIAYGKFLTGAFNMGAQVFDQWDSRIEASFQGDDFTTNRITFLAEERLALAVYRPEAFVYGSMNPVNG